MTNMSAKMQAKLRELMLLHISRVTAQLIK